ncbi:hypothetical protein E2C01_074235 [Portunus trituberculatus]|uniref:Uncharacterized protein n=1 Tax=Portunus trituberculatus TaxID=210409 RepID=A0A5B7IGJ9_PORTR|nr:hypothetical protein [Portunus trituberculatus]
MTTLMYPQPFISFHSFSLPIFPFLTTTFSRLSASLPRSRRHAHLFLFLRLYWSVNK